VIGDITPIDRWALPLFAASSDGSWSPLEEYAALSLAERIEFNLAEPRQDHRVLKLACPRIAGARERRGARMFERECSVRSGLGSQPHERHQFQVAFRIAINCDDDMIGHRQCQVGFNLSAEDLPVRLSATTS